MASPAPRAATDFWGNLERRINIEWLAATAAMLMLTMGLSYFSAPMGLTRLDYAFYDQTLASAAPQRQRDDIVVIAIDDNSIEQIGYWPWRRALHARLLERLGQARVVGFDLVLSDLNPAYPQDDALLARAIAQHGKVVLPLVVDNERRQALPPQPPLARAAAALGFINIYPDGDGVIRSLVLRQHLTSGRDVDHFIVAMLATAGEATPAPPEKPLLIPYAHPSSPFVSYPYKQVLDGAVPASAFKDKYVLVGSWASGLGDAFPTPLSRQGEAMAGVEILANGLHSALLGQWIVTPSRWQAAALACLPVLLACIALRRLSPRRSFLATLGVLLLIAAASWLLMRYAQAWMPITASIIGVALAYPLWSWRSQEAALQHIDRELDSLNRERLALGDDISAVAHAVNDDSLPARITQLQNTIALLRHAHGRREDTLRFLSHDMRAPQSSILALTQLQSHDHALSQDELLERINQHAHRTLDLVDSFVQLTRAEAAKINRRRLDLVDLITQSCDDLWAQATQSDITVVFDEHPDQAWTEGDPAMLRRAWCNLLDNAIKYSAPHTTVTCRVQRDGPFWLAAITDQGRGIASRNQHELFRPFSRIRDEGQGHPSGAGLGLAFVKTVINRHGGSIELESEENRGTTFFIRLPAVPAPD